MKLCNESFLGKWPCEDGLSFCCRDSYCSLYRRATQLIAECDSDLMALHKELIAVSVLGWYYRNKKTHKKKERIKECLISNHVRPSVCLWPSIYMKYGTIPYQILSSKHDFHDNQLTAVILIQGHQQISAHTFDIFQLIVSKLVQDRCK